jgi:16S rRNA (cytosine967-C5)-methyltransferase
MTAGLAIPERETGTGGSHLAPWLAHLLDTVASAHVPADQALERHVRQHALGARDRRWLGDALFLALRHLRLLCRCHGAARAQQDKQVLDHVARAVLDHVVRGDGPDWPADCAGVEMEMDPADRLSLPDWLWHRLVQDWGVDEAGALALALLHPATVDVRVHGGRGITRQSVLQQWQQGGVAAVATPWAPQGIRLPGRVPIGEWPEFRSGLVEIQDEGSQLITYLLVPRAGWKVVDLCAGAGGKTLQLAERVGPSGRVVAADTSPERLQRLRARAKRAGVAGRVVHMPVRHERDTPLHGWQGQADAVLVDAPCSGTGTLRRRPDLKWSLRGEEVDALHWKQAALLAAGAGLVRPGGWLVYATCSLLRRENEEVVAGFLRDQRGSGKRGRFVLVPAGPVLARQGIVLPQPDGEFLSLSPHRTATDGFFAALFQRL